MWAAEAFRYYDHACVLPNIGGVRDADKIWESLAKGVRCNKAAYKGVWRVELDGKLKLQTPSYGEAKAYFSRLKDAIIVERDGMPGADALRLAAEVEEREPTSIYNAPIRLDDCRSLVLEVSPSINVTNDEWKSMANRCVPPIHLLDVVEEFPF